MYTVQTFATSGNWAAPEPTDVQHARNKRAVLRIVEHWVEEVERYDDPQVASALVWIGEYKDVTDLYPDFEVTTGPRGGLRWAKC